METVVPILTERCYKDLSPSALLSKLSLCRVTSCLRPMEDRILVEKLPDIHIP
jgi:ribosomal protein S14